MQRRSLLTALMALAAASAAPRLALAESQPRRLPWRNWSGSQQCLPQARLAPASVAELQAIVKTHSGIIRPVGSGHSFAPLVPTDDTLVSLARLSGLVSHDPETMQATVYAGTRLGDIGAPLHETGQALTIMPDIDAQALAGSLATGTHGTGADLGAMHAYVTGLQLVTANGELISCNAEKNAELFQAARVSLGSLGIVTEVTMQNQAPYNLKRETRWMDIEDILENAHDWAAQHRNFEFFYIPFSGKGFTESLDITNEPAAASDKIDMNDGTEDLKMVRDWLQDWPWLRELVLGTSVGLLDDEVLIESSWKNFVHERNVRFNEMEYHLPRESGLAALREIREALEQQHHEVFFPIEVRYIKGDDVWLSPFYQRDSMSIAVHRYFEEDFAPYFRTLEPIMRKHGGRPHWGKLNTMSGEELRAVYPRWDDFNKVRGELDPKGRFLNSYLQNLFG